MRFQPHFIEEIRARVACSQVVGRKVQLKKQGREWRGLSPFNKEKTPSFFVNDAKGRWFDFSAGKDGDIFDFVRETEGLTFAEAVERLAGEAGLSIPAPDPQAVKREARRLTIVEVLEEAAEIFRRNLKGATGACDYLSKRGVDRGLCSRFGIGLATPDRSVVKQAMANVAPDILEGSGLLISGDDIPVSYDRFRNRVMFPIRNVSGRVIGFGGRALGDDNPKYLNTPETETFHKGAILYNADQARQPAHDGDQLVIVEGYFDVITPVGAGFLATVGTMGTAVTDDQLRAAWRMHDVPVMCFDGDAAGERAMLKAIRAAFPLLVPGRSLRFMSLPRGSDPDSLIRERGPAAYKSALGAAAPLSDTFWRLMVKSRSAPSPDAQGALEAEMLEAFKPIPDYQLRRKYEKDARNRIWRWARGSRTVVRSNGHSNHSASPGSLKLTRGLEPSRGFTLKEAVMLAEIAKAPEEYDPTTEDVDGVSEHTRAVLAEIAYLIGSLPDDEVVAALHKGSVGRAIDEARELCMDAGLQSVLKS